MAHDMTVGIDLAKNVFYLVGLNRQGKRVWRKKLKRSQLITTLAQMPQALIAMEACSSAHHWARQCLSLGLEPMLLPAQHIKGYLRGQKNDYNDAEAIAEAALHGRLRPVMIKSLEQQDCQSLLRTRDHLQKRKTAEINHLRGLLSEYGISLPTGANRFYQELPFVIEDADNPLTPIIRQLAHQGYERLRAINAELDSITQQIDQQAKENEACQLLMTIPGFGPIVSSLFANWLGNGQQFRRGRDTASAIGLVPRQHSSGGKQQLSSITKRGDKALRTHLIMGARSVVIAAKKKDDRLSQWIQRLLERRGMNKTVVAVANKLARIGWAVITNGQPYRIMA